MLDKKAKFILKKIYQNCNKYVCITENWYYWKTEEQMIAEKFGCDEKIWKDIYQLNERYYSFCQYCKETLPEWKTVETIPFADNSVEIKQVDKNGNIRYKMVTPPSGDLCY